MKYNVTVKTLITGPQSFNVETCHEPADDSLALFARELTTRTVSLEEQAIREGLIALGWTPPLEAIVFTNEHGVQVGAIVRQSGNMGPRGDFIFQHCDDSGRQVRTRSVVHRDKITSRKIFAVQRLRPAAE